MRASGDGKDGEPVFLADIWPTLKEVRDVMESALKPEVFRKLYKDFAGQNPKWNEIPSSTGNVYEWDAKSTYIQEPPFFTTFDLQPFDQEIKGAKPLGIFWRQRHDRPHFARGQFQKNFARRTVSCMKTGGLCGLQQLWFAPRQRPRDDKGNFCQCSHQNLMVPGVEGGITKVNGTGEVVSIYDAAQTYAASKTPLIVIAGQEYGTGSSRDWAAKGTNLLGVKAVVAQSFERIHRSILVGMGVLPLQFKEGVSAATLNWLDGNFRCHRTRCQHQTTTGFGASHHPRQRRDRRCRRALPD